VFISPSKKGASLLGTVERQPNPFQARLDNFTSTAEEDLLETDEGVEEDGRPMPGMIRPQCLTGLKSRYLSENMTQLLKKSDRFSIGFHTKFGSSK
jgi:hypothetical protein